MRTTFILTRYDSQKRIMTHQFNLMFTVLFQSHEHYGAWTKLTLYELWPSLVVSTCMYWIKSARVTMYNVQCRCWLLIVTFTEYMRNLYTICCTCITTNPQCAKNYALRHYNFFVRTQIPPQFTTPSFGQCASVIAHISSERVLFLTLWTCRATWGEVSAEV